MSKSKKPQSLSWEAFQSLGDPDNAPGEQDVISANNSPSFLKDKIRVYLERKGRSGKTVSIVKGLTPSNQSIETLAQKLKASCGTGGYIEEGQIIIQGDQRKKIIDFFVSSGYSDVKNAGH